jgi:hypothetical protein
MDLDPSSLFYPTAIYQLFTGIYFMELCLAGLFFLIYNADSKAVYTIQVIIIIFTIIFTALFHYSLNYRYRL